MVKLELAIVQFSVICGGISVLIAVPSLTWHQLVSVPVPVFGGTVYTQNDRLRIW
jgi:hypothetical protein